MEFPFNHNIPGPRTHSNDCDFPEENNYSDAVLRYIDQALMEDDLEDKACTIQDSALHAAEKSLHELLNNKRFPSLPNQHLPREETSSGSDDSIAHCCSNFSNSYTSACDSAESSFTSHAVDKFNFHYRGDTADGLLAKSTGNSLLENQPSWQFSGLIPESMKMLSSGYLHTEESRLNPPEAEEKFLQVEDNARKDDQGELPENLHKGRKTLHREENDLEEGRSNKHFAVHADESILHEMFDKVLSFYGGNDEPASSNTLDRPLPKAASLELLQQNEMSNWSNLELPYARKGVTRKEAVDTRSLLLQCMQSVAGGDHQNANKLLRQIRLRSSPSGDGTQRLAHYFANGLDARLLGAGSPEYKAITSRSNASEAEVLKALKLYLSAFPFMETSYYFAAEMIMELAEKATGIHIIHFGIICGLQWPPLIHRLSTRPGGPPKLRITGIDLPQDGFRPDARVKETGPRLANCCKRFNVPFEYNGFAKRWETVGLEDLRIEKGEVLVVNCLYQFMYLLDDTIMEQSQRDAVLNLIRGINPDIFIHGIVNGNYNSPFFNSRFREALFYFSTLFDMFEANVAREHPHRMLFEREIWGNEILNVVACEGLQRIERPETYKQWRVRTLRAGFKQLRLNEKIMKKLRGRVKSCYHKDFFVDEASQWMLEGWKGRVLFAFSCWKPA